MTNFERLKNELIERAKNTSVNDLAEYFASTGCSCHCCAYRIDCILSNYKYYYNCKDGIKEWLESEVTE